MEPDVTDGVPVTDSSPPPDQITDAQLQSELDARTQSIAQGPEFTDTPRICYEYCVTGSSFQDEIEEWYSYKDGVDSGLRSWDGDDVAQSLGAKSYLEFVAQSSSKNKDAPLSLHHLSCLLYIAQGSFADSTGIRNHIQRLHSGCDLLLKGGTVLSLVLDTLFTRLDELLGDVVAMVTSKATYYDPVVATCLTILYHVTVSCLERHIPVPGFTDLPAKLIASISRMRYGGQDVVSLKQLHLLLWKVLVLELGDQQTLEDTASAQRQKYDIPEEDDSLPVVTASPIDYEAFRQDVTARYPSFVPPKSIIPAEIDTQQSLSSFVHVPRPLNEQQSNTQLPAPQVHLATPAPSPPLTPATTSAKGQKVKRSVYQKNQSFPFLFPSDNGDTVPESIKEAVELFSSRVRTDVATKQLWDVRKEFMRQERGWLTVDEMIGELSLDSETPTTPLEKIESIYAASLEHLNSFVAVSSKFLLANIVFFADGEGEFDGDQMEYIRSSEISLKAVSSVIVLLAKWFKVNHVMQFEHFATLLFDTRFFLLVYRFFYAHDTLEASLRRTEVRSKGFFYKSMVLSQNPDARDFDQVFPILMPVSPNTAHNVKQVTVFNQRYVMTSINLVQTLRVIVSKKTQRIIVVAELPSDTLKKALAIRQPDLNKAVWNLFKEQIPFNGRKWKYANMDIISQIYLNCKLDLRDDWLVGTSVTSEVDDAYPQEVALRALVQFFNTLRYPKQMEKLGFVRKTADFFAAEED
ncbi:Factor arrest protein 11 [Yarrowia sp. C11]|nr:Factor arrest protein 11 [Yarrowia sp. E02]KAG5373404.1 Factor arrest protein 11 [Yarrowia sp. C11]